MGCSAPSESTDPLTVLTELNRADVWHTGRTCEDQVTRDAGHDHLRNTAPLLQPGSEGGAWLLCSAPSCSLWLAGWQQQSAGQVASSQAAVLPLLAGSAWLTDIKLQAVNHLHSCCRGDLDPWSPSVARPCPLIALRMPGANIPALALQMLAICTYRHLALPWPGGLATIAWFSHSRALQRPRTPAGAAASSLAASMPGTPAGTSTGAHLL